MLRSNVGQQVGRSCRWWFSRAFPLWIRYRT